MPLLVTEGAPRTEVSPKFSTGVWLNWYSRWLLPTQCASTLQVRVLLPQPILSGSREVWLFPLLSERRDRRFKSCFPDQVSKSLWRVSAFGALHWVRRRKIFVEPFGYPHTDPCCVVELARPFGAVPSGGGGSGTQGSERTRTRRQGTPTTTSTPRRNRWFELEFIQRTKLPW